MNSLISLILQILQWTTPAKTLKSSVHKNVSILWASKMFFKKINGQCCKSYKFHMQCSFGVSYVVLSVFLTLFYLGGETPPSWFFVITLKPLKMLYHMNFVTLRSRIVHISSENFRIQVTIVTICRSADFYRNIFFALSNF